MILRAAFRWTESNLLHWLLLLGADRINTLEGVFEDLARARMPNWRFLLKLALVLGVVAGIVALLSRGAD